jgi:hypothetical protein
MVSSLRDSSIQEFKTDEYFKIMRPDFIHNGFKYEMGLNKLKGDFNNNKLETCCPGRLYFTTKSHISTFFSWGYWIVTIKLPTDDPQFKMIRDRSGNKWGANMIIIEKKYSLFDIKTYETLGLNIIDNNYIVYYASITENINFLNWWVKSGINLYYSDNCIDDASKLGKIKTLDWWKLNLKKLKYTITIIEKSCMGSYKNINVVKWWFASGLKFRFGINTLNIILFYADVEIKKLFEHFDVSNICIYDSDELYCLSVGSLM